MDSEDLSEVMASLYLFYKDHSENLQDAGYSPTEAFWISFACLPFLPWHDRSENRFRLSQALRLYLGIYQFYIDSSMKPEREQDFIDLMRDRYHKVKNIISTLDPRQLNGELELGNFILPGPSSIEKQTHAGLVVLNTKLEWERQKSREPLPCKLVEDI